MEVYAPALITFEFTSALRNKVARSLLTMVEAERALNDLLAIPLTIVSPPDLHQHAWRLATQFNRPTAYDSHYLAVAAHLEVPIYTIEKRLYNAVKDGFPLIQFVA